ncbi:hypothetical protein [Lactobacillus delbrueckii]|uniref:hypothetical protein n=1 Tax=Lactobacillus delbrueckii TaxID=1584 RepID=UPI001E61633D|nr:hypothetical protein [Lactobacillus delbrueckii]
MKRAWEDENAAQRKLGEEAQLTMGQSPNSENYTEDGEHDKIKVNTINLFEAGSARINRREYSKIVKKRIYRALPPGARSPCWGQAKFDHRGVMQAYIKRLVIAASLFSLLLLPLFLFSSSNDLNKSECISLELSAKYLSNCWDIIPLIVALLSCARVASFALSVGVIITNKRSVFRSRLGCGLPKESTID